MESGLDVCKAALSSLFFHLAQFLLSKTGGMATSYTTLFTFAQVQSVPGVRTPSAFPVWTQRCLSLYQATLATLPLALG